MKVLACSVFVRARGAENVRARADAGAVRGEDLARVLEGSKQAEAEMPPRMMRQDFTNRLPVDARELARDI
jgi:hypothetical protein